MTRLLPVLGVLLTLAATRMVTRAGEWHLDGNFARQQAWITQERAKLHVPSAPGETYNKDAVELWLFPGEVVVNLASIEEFARATNTSRVATSARRSWSARRVVLGDTMSSEEAFASGQTYRGWRSQLDSQLGLASTFVGQRTRRSSQDNIQARILADRQATWSDVAIVAEHSADAGLYTSALTLSTEEGGSSDHILHYRCDEDADLHLTPTAVSLSFPYRELPTTQRSCTGTNCGEAAVGLLTAARSGESACLSVDEKARVEQVADVLSALHHEGIAAHLIR